MSTMLMLNNSLEILMVQSSNSFNPIYCSFLLADTFHHHVGKEQTHFEFETQKVSSAYCSIQLRLEAPGHVVYWRAVSKLNVSSVLIIVWKLLLGHLHG